MHIVGIRHLYELFDRTHTLRSASYSRQNIGDSGVLLTSTPLLKQNFHYCFSGSGGGGTTTGSGQRRLVLVCCLLGIRHYTKLSLSPRAAKPYRTSNGADVVGVRL